ncbi:MAG TPA: hypothetical protein VH234_02310 [Candidatus Saccharimonadales bacterium]|jgi:hypothetical protein|nr:hypothetical protein [Candidatus Saccharimonadales bacterium]
MANTDFRYSLEDFQKLPDWLQRSWNVFMRVSIRADYKQDIATTREAVQAGKAYQANEVIRIQRDYGLGQNMDKLIKLQFAKPDATDNELLNAITPTMRFINYGVGKVQPSDDPAGEFEANERLNKLYIEKRGIDLTRTKELTHLLIPPNTTKNELKSFIDEYYDDASGLISAGELYFESEKNTKKRITRVTKDSIIDERIYELRASGVYPKDITPLINAEFDRDLEPFEVNKRLNQMKRRKSRQ